MILCDITRVTVWVREHRIKRKLAELLSNYIAVDRPSQA